MKRLEELKKLLIVVDMVNGFVNEGNMADPGIAHIIPGIVDEVGRYEAEEEGVLFIKDTHDEDAAEFAKFPVHCLKGTRESELVEELLPFEERALVYEKNSTSAVFAPGLLEDIDKMEALEEVEICGCCSDICVLNLALPLTNFFDQVNRRVKIRVPANLMETYDSETHGRELYNNMTLLLMDQAGIDTAEV